MNWISVDERLPDFGVPVWASDGDRIVMLERFDDSDGWLWARVYYGAYHNGGTWYYDAECDDDYSHITHWMPLPEPPKCN